MPRLKETTVRASDPEQFLVQALRAGDAETRARAARAGLAAASDEIDPDTQFHLLRQLYLAQLELGQLQRAAEVAEQMVSTGALPDVAHHDRSRALAALGDREGAISEQRLAARAAPAARRSFHLWSLATLQHFAGDHESAVRTLRRAERWAVRDRPLIRAHQAWIQLDRGHAVEKLDTIIGSLLRARCREGYGRFVLGMLLHSMGDLRNSAVHLRAFLARNASASAAKEATLREELSRARTALARIESV